MSDDDIKIIICVFGDFEVIDVCEIDKLLE